MSQLIQNNIFRVSAVLYGNNNYDISLKQVYKKVIEDALYLLPQEGVSVGYLAEYIDKNYSLLFSPDEIQNTLDDKHYQDCFEFVPAGNEKKYLLSKKRRIHLQNIPPKKTLPEFIEQYLSDIGADSTMGECIMKFLYNMFTNNLDSFQRLLKTKQIDAAIAKGEMTDEDVMIINGFLDWDCEDKNIAIFDLSSYALEYCMISNHKDSHYKLDDLGHKTFYLDTNIIFRAIGINGEDRKTRSRLFLSKFKRLNCKIVISKHTQKEYQETIDYYINKLRHSESPAISSKVYVEYVSYDDIWKLYHTIKAQKFSFTIDLFVAYLKSEYRKICQDFDIQIEDEELKDIAEDDLNNLATEIKNQSRKKSLETALIDACNIKWIESKRTNKENSIFDSKIFMLSSDYGLCFWDSHTHSTSVPIVIQPSQWLSIILRYMDRTEDDFKSFVCFLNIKTTETKLTNEEVHIILEGISEITDSVDKQKFFLQSFIEEEFKRSSADLSAQQLKQLAKQSAERRIQQELFEQTAKADSLANEIDGYKNTISEQEERSKIKDRIHEQELQQQQEAFDREKSELNTENSLKDTLNRQLRNEIEGHKTRLGEQDIELEKYKRKEFKRKKIWSISWRLLLSAVLIAHIVWYFIVEETDNNYMASFLSWVKSLDPERKSLIPGIIISIVLVTVVFKLSKSALTEYKKTYEKENTESN